MSEKNGGPAFPRPRSVDNSGYHSLAAPAQEGMSLRDYFAAQAAAAQADYPNMDRDHAEVIARRAYWIADAMLAERNKP